MQKILIFSLAYVPHVGGAEVALQEITNRLCDREFHLITLRFAGEADKERIGNVYVHRIGNGSSYLQKILFIPRAARLAKRLHKKHSFDLLWAMMTYMVLPIVLMRFMGIKVPYVLTLQDGDPFEHVFSRWFIVPVRPLLRSGFKNASRVTAISNYLAAWAVRTGCQKERVVVIPNGVDIERFATIERGKKIDAAPSLVTTSRLVTKNAVDDIIRALVFLPDAVTLTIYGIGAEKSSLEELANSLDVSSRVFFMGHISQDDLPKMLATHDIFVRPSRSEGMGISFLEAMAMGLPTIATQEGGIADFLYDAKRNPGTPPTGWAVDVNAPEQIADAVKDIMTNPHKVEMVRANALALVREKYDWKGVVEAMGETFDQVAVTK